MANEENLIPCGHKFTQEEAKKGGRESGKKRQLQSAIKKVLESKANIPELQEVFEKFGIKKGDKNYTTAIACALVLKSAKGDLSAISLLRDTIGEKPVEEIDLNGGVVIVDDITDKT
jgi:hypothetical protein